MIIISSPSVPIGSTMLHNSATAMEGSAVASMNGMNFHIEGSVGSGASPALLGFCRV